MRDRRSWLPGLWLAALLALFLADNVVAKDKAPKVVNVQGTVQMLSKDASTITVQVKSTMKRQVVYSGDTKFLYGHSNDNKPGSADAVKEGNFISCVGTFDEKMNLKATQCVYRESK